MQMQSQEKLLKASILKQQLDLYFHSIQIKTKEKHVVLPLDYQAPAYSLNAIMGPSGSGKTTLLNGMAGRPLPKEMSIQGRLYLNGQVSKSMQDCSRKTAFVTQQDYLIACLTPFELLHFAVNIRIKKSQQLKDQLVDQIIERLGLQKCKNTRVGSAENKGLSGGQRKRTSIAIQLVTNPSIIFLDEPTTGLDSATALQVVNMLKELSEEGRTVILTIHQPSEKILQQFDNLLLLAEGRTIFNGKREGLDYFLSKFNLQFPSYLNTSQFIINLLISKKLQLQENDFQSKKNFIPTQKPLLPQNKEQSSVSAFFQFMLVLRRSFLCQLRSPERFQLKVIQSIFVAIICIVVYGRLDTDEIGVNNRMALLFLILSNNVFNGIQGSLLVYSEQKPVFIKQRLIYFWARSLSVLPFQVLYAIITPAIVYKIADFNDQHYQFLVFLTINVACYFTSSSFGLFYSSFIPKQMSMMLLPLMIVPFLILSGFFCKLSEISVLFTPFQIANPFRFASQAAFFNQFDESSMIDPRINPIYPDNKQGFSPAGIEKNVLVLLLMGLLVRVLGMIIMWITGSPRRVSMKQQQ